MLAHSAQIPPTVVLPALLPTFCLCVFQIDISHLNLYPSTLAQTSTAQPLSGSLYLSALYWRHKEACRDRETYINKLEVEEKEFVSKKV
jgi:hypothetical protein